MEALAGEAAREYLNLQDRRVTAAASVLKTAPSDLVARIETMLDERKKLERELAEARKSAAMGGGANGAASDIETINGVKVMVRMMGDMDSKALKGLVDENKATLGSGIVVLISTNAEGKASLFVGATADQAQSNNSVDLVRAGSSVLGGKGGGGRPDLAQGGGPDGAKAADAIAAIKALIKA
jgi:alanyl-tRNA synthetase